MDYVKWDSSQSLVSSIYTQRRARLRPLRHTIRSAFQEMPNGLTPREMRALLWLVNLYWMLRRRRWLHYY